MRRLEIEYLRPGEIEPYANNVKLHPAEQIEEIKESIKRYGINDPIAIWNGVIVEGHGRLVAALELGMEEIPVIRLDDLTDEQRRAYALVHNKVTMDSGFDLDLLSLELEDLEGMGLDAFGFDIGELPDFTEAEPREDKEKKPKTIICPHCGKTIEV